MLVSLPLDKLAEIQQLALALLQTLHVTVHKVMSFLGKANFCTNGHSQLWHLCRVIQSDMLSVYHSLTQLFSGVFIFLLRLYINWNGWLNYNQVLFQCNFHFLMWSLLLMLHPLIGPFIFRDLGDLYQLVVHGPVPCLELILPCRSFRLLQSCYVGWPSTYLVRWLPCIWITVLLRLTCVIKVVQCLLFLSRLACQILSLTDKHGNTLLPAYIPTHLNVEADVLSRDRLLPEWHLLPQVAQAAFRLWGLPEVDLLASSRSTQCQHYFTLETPLPLGALGLNVFSHPWNFQVSYVFPPLALVPLVLSKFLAEHVNGQLRHLLLVAPCWMEAP